MEPFDEKENLFGLKLDDEAVSHLEKIFRSTRWIYITGFLLCLVTLADAALRLRTAVSSDFSGWMIQVLRFYPFFLIVSSALFYLQIRKSFQFGKTAHEAIRNQDTTMLSRSLMFLSRAYVIALVQIVLNLVTYILVLYIYNQLN